MSALGGPRGARRVAVHLYSLALLASAGALLTVADAWFPHASPLSVPWWALIPAYAIGLVVPLEFEFRSEARSITLSQLPLALGLVFVAPWWHVAARLGGTVVDSVLWRRQPPVKVLYNLGCGAVEVATSAVVLYALTDDLRAGPALWLGLLVSLAVADVVTNLATTVVLALVVGPQSPRDVLHTVLSTLATSVVFAGFAIISVAAMMTDRATSAVVALTVGCLILAYRAHRRLAQTQKQTSELQQFVKGLGALDLQDDAGVAVLARLRELLHAHSLELLLHAGNGHTRYSVTHDDTVQVETVDGTSPTGWTPAMGRGREDQMSAPLSSAHGIFGLLTVRERLGPVRGFDLRDLRLLEVVAAELGGAVDRGRLQRDLAFAATRDALTRLPNLNEASRQLDELLSEHATGVLVAAVAVDSFREVNDTLGHQVGDELLLEVSRRLRLAMPEALIGRIGGGRFLVAQPSRGAGEDTSMFGLGLRAQVEGGAQLGPVGTHIRLSVGCVRGPEHGADAATLVRRAETAMYSARHAHGGPVVWEPAYEVEGQRRLAVVMALREAIASGAIGVAYQPKINAHDHSVTGVEALARWTHPALGAISPAEFIPLAEAAGLMGPLTSSLLRQSLTACKGWQRRGGRVGVAVNVSADTVLDPAFVTEVAAIMTSVNISPDLLTLELTEGVVVDDPELASVRMNELRALGVKLSVDDFGTGYSSLTYLKGLPVDEVKVDKGFVDGITHDPADRAVVRAVVDIAHTLGLRVVAEGVEQDEQHALLAQLGVDEIQGYLHARPMPALDVVSWLRRRDETRTDGRDTAPAPRRA